MNIKQKRDYSIQSVSIAMSILELFSKGMSEYTLSELCRLLNVNKNKIFRLLATLELKEFISRNHITGGYRLGSKALSLGYAYVNSREIVAESRLVIEELSAICKETVSLESFRHDSIIVEDVLESTYPMRAVLREGETLSIDCSAAGMIYTAYVDSVRNKNALKTKAFKIYEVLNSGYAVVNEGSGRGLVEIAAPIRNHNSNVIGAVSIHGPNTRMVSAPYLTTLSLMVRDAAKKISNHMGYCAPVDEYGRGTRTELRISNPKYYDRTKLQSKAMSSAF